MRFEVQVRNDMHGGKPWIETYDRVDVTTNAAAAFAGTAMINEFNRTLRSGETRRLFIQAQIVGPTINGKHEWSKASLVTECDHTGYFDRMECKACGAEGRRYGFASITLMGKWRKKQLCTPNPLPKEKSMKKLDPDLMNLMKACTLNLTPWFDIAAEGNPVRPGMYQTKSGGDVSYQTYSEGMWTDEPPVLWRGVTEDMSTPSATGQIAPALPEQAPAPTATPTTRHRVRLSQTLNSQLQLPLRRERISLKDL